MLNYLVLVLNHFMLVFPLYNIWEHQNIFNILMLLVGIKRELGPENGSAISIFPHKKIS